MAVENSENSSQTHTYHTKVPENLLAQKWSFEKWKWKICILYSRKTCIWSSVNVCKMVCKQVFVFFDRQLKLPKSMLIIVNYLSEIHSYHALIPLDLQEKDHFSSGEMVYSKHLSGCFLDSFAAGFEKKVLVFVEIPRPSFWPKKLTSAKSILSLWLHYARNVCWWYARFLFRPEVVGDVLIALESLHIYNWLAILQPPPLSGDSHRSNIASHCWFQNLGGPCGLWPAASFYIL